MTSFRTPGRRIGSATAAVLAAVALAGCGDQGDGRHGGHGDSSGSPSKSAAQGKHHNDADIAFAQSMIPHHRQAVEMSELAEKRASSPDVERLAAKIEKAQAPEITRMSGWLKGWGEPVPKASTDSGHGGHGGHGGGDADMSGMMSDADMKKLRRSSGAKFDTMFLEMMIEHHEGAVSMAKTERKSGIYGPAKKMAGEIIRTQRAEITEMNELLDK